MKHIAQLHPTQIVAAPESRPATGRWLAAMSSLTLLVLPMTTTSCKSMSPTTSTTFSDDLKFLSRHTDVIVLSDTTGQAKVAVVPAYQGRVMTSSARGDAGTSFGWVNRELIASGKFQPHINVFGGEDRFWLGPEGGQFSIFFGKDVPFDLEHWFTPAPIDTEPFETVEKGADFARFRREMTLTNYSGTSLQVEAQREVRLVPAATALAPLGIILPPDVRSVGFESVNTIRNTGNAPWRKETGLLSIWILGMFNASPKTTVVVPYVSGPEASLGPVVNDTYFGKVPADRLARGEQALFFQADAGYRSKIGISPRRAKPWLGSYDAANGVLTLVEFTLPKGVTDYVNSMWELQKEPYGGDAVNSYNDGPPKPGAAQLGKFYELESSSPALALKPGESATHRHRTFHLEGSPEALDGIARKVLGVGLSEIASVLAR